MRLLKQALKWFVGWGLRRLESNDRTAILILAPFWLAWFVVRAVVGPLVLSLARRLGG